MHPTKLFIVITMLLFPQVSEAKKRCKPLLEKLHNVQAMQRSGYSTQRGDSLRAREDKARDKWWQCETGKSKKLSKKKKKKSKALSSSSKIKHSKNKVIKAGTPFKTNRVVVIKSKYQGDKKRAWLGFYQQPIQCQQPKSLQVFAFCSENKQAQQTMFEQKYKLME